MMYEIADSSKESNKVSKMVLIPGKIKQAMFDAANAYIQCHAHEFKNYGLSVFGPATLKRATRALKIQRLSQDLQDNHNIILLAYALYLTGSFLLKKDFINRCIDSKAIYYLENETQAVTEDDLSVCFFAECNNHKNLVLLMRDFLDDPNKTLTPLSFPMKQDLAIQNLLSDVSKIKYALISACQDYLSLFNNDFSSSWKFWRPTNAKTRAEKIQFYANNLEDDTALIMLALCSLKIPGHRLKQLINDYLASIQLFTTTQIEEAVKKNTDPHFPSLYTNSYPADPYLDYMKFLFHDLYYSREDANALRSETILAHLNDSSQKAARTYFHVPPPAITQKENDNPFASFLDDPESDSNDSIYGL